MDKKQGAKVASAVALMLGVVGCGDGGSSSGDDVGSSTQPLRCHGINSCAGEGECSGPNGENDCQGNNSCAGMGWVTVETEEDCTGVGGTLLETE